MSDGVEECLKQIKIENKGMGQANANNTKAEMVM